MKDKIQSVLGLFYSQKFYADLIRRSSSIGMGFILLLVLIDSLAVLWGLPALYNAGGKLQQIVVTLPAATVKTGKISIDQPTPYIIGGKELGETDSKKIQDAGSFVFDPNYEVKDLNALIAKMHDEHITLLLTADKMITLKNKSEVKIDDLSKLPDYTISHETWLRAGQYVKLFFVPVLLLFVFIGLFLVDFVRVLFGAVVIKLISVFMKAPPDFAASVRVAAAASIPVALVLLPVPKHPGWISFLLWLGYVGFALWSCRQDNRTSNAEPAPTL